MFAAISAWCLALAIGQAPQNEVKRLDAIPSDVQIVVRFRGLQPARDDLIKMLEAMSPNLAAMGKPSIDNALKSASDRLGKTLASAPMLFAVRLPAAVPQGIPPKIAILAESNDYDGAMKARRGRRQAGKEKKRRRCVHRPQRGSVVRGEGDRFHRDRLRRRLRRGDRQAEGPRTGPIDHRRRASDFSKEISDSS